MSRKQNPPNYPRKAHASGQARIRISGVDCYLGVWGTPESHAEYQRRIQEWRAGHRVLTGSRRGGARTVADLLAPVAAHVAARYRQPDGKPSAEVAGYRAALRPVRELYGDVPVQDFGPLALQAVRQTWIDRGVSRGVINQWTARIVRMWRWAASQELIPYTLAEALGTVRGIPMGTPGVTDRPDVPPVPQADLDATLAQLGHVLRAAVRLQLLTAARPGEILRLRPCDLDRSPRVEIERGHWLDTGGRVWVKVFRRGDDHGGHKNAGRGHGRILLFGPKAQAVLTPFLDRDPLAYLFRPQETLDAQANGRRATAKREHYTVDKLGQAVRRACLRAGVPNWHPHQLRHSAATHLVEQFGWEVAQLVLGHRTLSATRIYAANRYGKAVEAIFQVG